ncbi:MAG: nucleotide exchange factor GrpE [Promethearchaeota archaeon]
MSETPEPSKQAAESEETTSEPKEVDASSEAAGTPKSDTEEPKPQPPSIEELLEIERKRVEELETKLAYQKAEHVNALKAMERRRAEVIEQANRDLLLQLLPVLDDLELAFLMVPVTDVNQQLIEGLKMVIAGFKATLKAAGVTPIECEGKSFDPLRHEVISQEATTEHSPNKILEELRKGYLLKGKLLRTSLVKIAVAPKAAKEKSEQQPEEEEPSTQDND